MPKYLISQYNLAEFQIEVEAKNKEEAWNKFDNDDVSLVLVNDGEPIAYHDTMGVEDEIEEIKEGDND